MRDHVAATDVRCDKAVHSGAAILVFKKDEFRFRNEAGASELRATGRRGHLAGSPSAFLSSGAVITFTYVGVSTSKSFALDSGPTTTGSNPASRTS